MSTPSDPQSSDAESSKAKDVDESAQAKRDLDKIRAIINEKALEKERLEQEEKAREYVSSVVTEALNDRQQQDASVGHIISPIVEQTMQKSMQVYREQFTDYLYPLVGDLARKFTVQILRDFVEKTNEVIENTISFKSFAWRFRAWRAGVSYPHYVASQTFVFQIKQILLIHKKTGLLLNSVSEDYKDEQNSDLVSAMLTAINDFVSDSFSSEKEQGEQQLDEIKTDEFTLYIRQGSQAVLVAAVTGSISPKAKIKLQSTLEQIHNLYLPQLNTFNGDTKAFASCREYLHDCLLSEQKETPNKKKSPIFASLFFTALILLCAYWAYFQFLTLSAKSAIENLPQNQGIVVTQAEVNGLKSIDLKILRDPRAESIEVWLEQADVNITWLNISEVSFVSLAPPIIENSIKALVNDYPSLSYQQETQSIAGVLNVADYYAFQRTFTAIDGIETIALTQNIQMLPSTMPVQTINEVSMNNVAGEITQLQVNFALASAEISPLELSKLATLASKFAQLQAYADSNGLDAKLLILGTSDNIGDIDTNERLSTERAINTQKALESLGVKKEDMMVAGLGIIEVTGSSTNIRKAIVNLVYNQK